MGVNQFRFCLLRYFTLLFEPPDFYCTLWEILLSKKVLTPYLSETPKRADEDAPNTSFTTFSRTSQSDAVSVVGFFLAFIIPSSINL